MKHLTKFTLKDSTSISTEEMKEVRGGVTPAEFTLYDCEERAGVVINEGQKCIYDKYGKNEIIIGTCRADYIDEGYGRKKVIAYCEMDE